MIILSLIHLHKRLDPLLTSLDLWGSFRWDRPRSARCFPARPLWSPPLLPVGAPLPSDSADCLLLYKQGKVKFIVTFFYFKRQLQYSFYSIEMVNYNIWIEY